MSRKEMTLKEYRSLLVVWLSCLLGSLLALSVSIIAHLGLLAEVTWILISGYFLGVLVLHWVLKAYLAPKKGGEKKIES